MKRVLQLALIVLLFATYEGGQKMTEQVQAQPAAVNTTVVENAPSEQTAVVAPTPRPTTGCEAYKHLVGQYDWDTNTAMAVMRAESGCKPSATNKANKNGSVDRGLFQVNSVHKAKVSNLDDLYDPATNIRIAYRVYQGSGWKAWSVYNSGAYQRYL